MKIHEDIDTLPDFTNPVVTSGTFDGVHIGHKAILRRVVQVAEKNNGESILITFWPHPRTIIKPEQKIYLLSSFKEKVKFLTNLGIQHLIRIPFTPEFRELSSEEFIQNVLVDAIGTKKLVIGYDHRFGKNREGSFEYLKEYSKTYGFDVEEIPEQEIDSVAVSSSKIRKSLEKGDVQTAKDYLGRPYSIFGMVVKGDQIGRKIGYPTANIRIDDENKLIPQDGVYAAMVSLKEEVYKAMVYIGTRPTIGENQEKKVEVNLIDFHKEIYGEFISIDLIDHIRGDQKFHDLNQLREQIRKDKSDTLKVLSNFK